jgi:hypothetical protein
MLRLRGAGFEVRAVLAGRSAQWPSDAAAFGAFGVGASRVSREADIRDLTF